MKGYPVNPLDTLIGPAPALLMTAPESPDRSGGVPEMSVFVAGVAGAVLTGLVVLVVVVVGLHRWVDGRRIERMGRAEADQRVSALPVGQQAPAAAGETTESARGGG